MIRRGELALPASHGARPGTPDRGINYGFSFNWKPELTAVGKPTLAFTANDPQITYSGSEITRVPNRGTAGRSHDLVVHSGCTSGPVTSTNIGSRACWEFNQANDRGMTTEAITSVLTGKVTVILVFDQDASSTSMRYFANGDGSGGGYFGGHESSASKSMGNGSTRTDAGVAPSQTVYTYIFSDGVNTTQAQLTEQTSTTHLTAGNTGSNDLSGLSVGCDSSGGANMIGEIATILVYDGEATLDSTWSGLITNFVTYYSL